MLTVEKELKVRCYSKLGAGMLWCSSACMYMYVLCYHLHTMAQVLCVDVIQYIRLLQKVRNGLQKQLKQALKKVITVTVYHVFSVLDRYIRHVQCCKFLLVTCTYPNYIYETLFVI